VCTIYPQIWLEYTAVTFEWSTHRPGIAFIALGPPAAVVRDDSGTAGTVALPAARGDKSNHFIAAQRPASIRGALHRRTRTRRWVRGMALASASAGEGAEFRVDQESSKIAGRGGACSSSAQEPAAVGHYEQILADRNTKLPYTKA
jgi:hypothetical protein